MSEEKIKPLYRKGDRVAVVNKGIPGLASDVFDSVAYGVVASGPSWRAGYPITLPPGWVYYLDCFDSSGKELIGMSNNWFFEAELVKLCS